MIHTIQGLSVTVGGASLPVEGLTVNVPDPPPASGVSDSVGEWTPIIGGAAGESGQTYHFQSGHWHRMGRLVHLWAYTQFAATGEITGPLMLKGFPFPTRNLPGYFGGLCSYFSNFSPNAAQVSSVTLYASGGQTQAGIYGVVPSSNPRPLNGADINNGTQLVLSLAYFTE